MKIVAAAQFKAECLKLIEAMNRDGEPITITRRGKPVAVLSPAAQTLQPSLIGAARGSVRRYDDPFAPATEAADSNAHS